MNVIGSFRVMGSFRLSRPILQRCLVLLVTLGRIVGMVFGENLGLKSSS